MDDNTDYEAREAAELPRPTIESILLDRIEAADREILRLRIMENRLNYVDGVLQQIFNDHAHRMHDLAPNCDSRVDRVADLVEKLDEKLSKIEASIE